MVDQQLIKIEMKIDGIINKNLRKIREEIQQAE